MKRLLPILRNGFAVLRQRHNRILAYHSVSEVAHDPWTISPAQLESHLYLLDKHGFAVRSLTEVVSMLEQGQTVRNTVCLTFDDGFLDFKTNALPILQAWHAPATVFMPLGKIGDSSDWSRYAPHRPLMSLNDLAAIRAAGITVGSHTLSHRRLPTLSQEQAQIEIENSIELLRQLLAIDDFHLAYPYGDCTQRERMLAKQAGYRSALIFGGLWGNNSLRDRWMLTREPMLASHGPLQLLSILQGRHDWIELLRTVKHKVRIS